MTGYESDKADSTGRMRSGPYSEAEKGPHAVFELGDFELEGGAVLRDARLLYKTHGTLSSGP